MPIHRGIKNFFTLQILQPVGVIPKHFRDFEGPNPEGFKLVVFASILPRCIPLKHHISQLKFLFSGLPVKGLLDLLLLIMSSVHYLLSGLLHFHQLMNSSNHMIWPSFIILKEFDPDYFRHEMKAEI